MARREVGLCEISELKVGPLVYGVVRAPITEHGLCDYRRQTITIQTELHPRAARVVLWHELVHAMLYQLGYNEHDEKLVDGLAHCIVSVLDDNPDLKGPCDGF